MSIITDALRKAEEERGLKTSQVVEKILVQADSEQAELLKRFGYTKPGAEEAVLPSRPLRIKAPSNVFVSLFQKTFVSVSLILICFFVVYLGPRWLINPGTFSEDLSFLKNSAISKINLLIPSQPAPEEPVMPLTGETALLPSQSEIKSEASVPASVVTEEVVQETQPVPVISVPVPAVVKEPEMAYVLSGISIMGNDRYAVVNGAIVQKGESVDGAYVKNILDREVILETRSAEIKLKLPS